MYKNKFSRLLFIVLIISLPAVCFSQVIKNIVSEKKLVLTTPQMIMTIDYRDKAAVTKLVLNGQTVIDSEDGICSSFKTKIARYTTAHLAASPVVNVNGNTAEIRGIAYGDAANPIRETWKFTAEKDIVFEITRTIKNPIEAEQAGLPVVTFASISTWDGAFQEYGGLAWFYLFNKPRDTYGVHSSGSQFWNSTTGNGLQLQIDAPGSSVALAYTRTPADRLTCSATLAPGEILPRFDADTHRRRFVRDTADVWNPVTLRAGTTRQTVRLSYFSFNDKYGRGTLNGINGDQVSAVLNTIARIGVIDKKHFGGNSWHTPYGPICLHEQYIAQLGLAINDPDYLKGYQECLDFYRDNAITQEGRVWPRWAYTNEDMMPGKVTNKGFYEAQWGYLLDSNPDIVTNVVELYNQTGDLAWLRTHQQSCEKALSWIMNRDSDADGLVEMITDSHTQKRGSDWIDIIWASYENAFVNAKLYRALTLWAVAEHQLGNETKSMNYSQAALRLKTAFNKPVSDGGFWDPAAKCYVHWLDKDGSVHGRNMVTPVNFMAIGYGICDDHARKAQILDAIETQMEQEKLFFWPLCMTTYAGGDGNDWQFPFPNYENGDIFLSWGALGVKAYASYKPELAVKYVKNVLAQYSKDGLAFQRYGRAKQDGLGDDILSGNSLSVAGLYQEIYGINPLPNRFYLNPHITPELAGSSLRYTFRSAKLKIDLQMNHFAVSTGRFSVAAARDFGFFADAKSVSFFRSDSEKPALTVSTDGDASLDIVAWESENAEWHQSSVSGGEFRNRISGLTPGKEYTVTADGKVIRRAKAGSAGTLEFRMNIVPSSSHFMRIN